MRKPALVKRAKPQFSLHSNFPFTRDQSPIGEETRPSTLTLKQWMRDPSEFQPATKWSEDRQPEKDFLYGPNAKSTRYALYNKGIQPTFALPSLTYFMPLTTLARMVARGLYPVNTQMEEQAAGESLFKLKFMEALVAREGRQ